MSSELWWLRSRISLWSFTSFCFLEKYGDRFGFECFGQ